MVDKRLLNEPMGPLHGDGQHPGQIPPSWSNNAVNHIHGAYVDGSLHIAVATDGGVTVFNWDAQTAVDYTSLIAGNVESGSVCT